MFKVDFDRLILWLIPTFLRKEKLYTWIRILVSPAVALHKEFLKNRDSNLYKLSHGSQVYSMEAVLNDKYDKQERRIYITDGFTKDRIYCYTRAENKPLYLGEFSMHNRADYGDTGVDFIVWIPAAVFMSPENLIEAKALVDFYKRASKRFKIYRS